MLLLRYARIGRHKFAVATTNLVFGRYVFTHCFRMNSELSPARIGLLYSFFNADRIIDFL